MHKNVLIYFCLIISPPALYGSDLRVHSTTWTKESGTTDKLTFIISWKNSWRNEKNYDAAWVFIKYTSPDYLKKPVVHARISDRDFSATAYKRGGPKPVITIADDGVGFFVFSSAAYRGDVEWKVDIRLLPVDKDVPFVPDERLIEVHAIEMVYVPDGPFWVGDADTTARSQAALYRYGLKDKGPFKVAVENESIAIGKSEGNLFYDVVNKTFQGDQAGSIPSVFPKGVGAFYIMKYEVSQGAYADFLNTLGDVATYQRANFAGRNYYAMRGTITLKDGRYVASSPDRPCNFITWDDACAFADWAGLRPFTELEFEKASRGPLLPQKNEFVWNTNSKDLMKRYVDESGDLKNDIDERELTDVNRDQFGASYFWVIDLSGSLWERCITIGDSTGRKFSGTHGDGTLGPLGAATNEDWPKGASQTSGFGFRGGGFYEHNMRYGIFNPHSPIGYRNFGAWSGGYRYHAYGSRFSRTASNNLRVK